MQKNILIGIIILAIVGSLAYIQMTNIKDNTAQTGDVNFGGSPSPTSSAQPSATPATLQLQDVKVGTGSAVKAGDTISIHYTGMLTNGQKFDSSLDSGKPFEVQIGVGKVIKGWDEGVIGMKVGGQRRLIIPPDLGYGAQGAGNVIPPNATLVFDLELLSIK